MQTIEYNSELPLEYYQERIDFINSFNANVIGVAQLNFKDVFIFATNKEAKASQDLLFHSDCVVSNVTWMGLKEFTEEVAKYEAFNNMKVLVHWIKLA
jgi:hypothetical protein